MEINTKVLQPLLIVESLRKMALYFDGQNSDTIYSTLYVSESITFCKIWKHVSDPTWKCIHN